MADRDLRPLGRDARRELFDDVHRAVLAAGAADGDGQVAPVGGLMLGYAPLDEAGDVCLDRPSAKIALDDALERLARLDPQQGRIIELRFFGGVSIQGTAKLLGISTATVNRDWKLARAWLHRELAS